jgi:hypothetical protein
MGKFSNSFPKDLPDDPLSAIRTLADNFITFDAGITTNSTRQKNYESYLEALALLECLTEMAGWNANLPPIGENILTNIVAIQNKLTVIRTEVEKKIAESAYSRIKDRFTTQFRTSFVYEFSDGDLAAIQQLLNKLREQIQKCKPLDDDHRRRLLKRLENLQKELHKRMSDLDRFWGLVGEAGVVIAKLGEDAKPIIGCVKQITEIIWHAQGRAEQLPSNTPQNLLLVEPKDSEEK